MAIQEYTLPNPDSRPRRVAISDDDMIYYADYSRGFLGRLNTKTGDVKVQISGRHPMDVLRTIAHELSHSNHGDTDGHTGSDEENREIGRAHV